MPFEAWVHLLSGTEKCEPPAHGTEHDLDRLDPTSSVMRFFCARLVLRLRGAAPFFTTALRPLGRFVSLLESGFEKCYFGAAYHSKLCHGGADRKTQKAKKKA